MEIKKIIGIGVLTYFMLGLFNWIQAGTLVFSYPILPAFNLFFSIAFFIQQKHCRILEHYLLLFVFSLQFLCSPFLLEILFSFQQQESIMQNQIMQYNSLLILILFLLLSVRLIWKKMNVWMRLLFMGAGVSAVISLILYPNLFLEQAIFCSSSLFVGLFIYFKEERTYKDFTSILLGIGVLYLVSLWNVII